ncbi:MAG: CHAT domain-containing protein [Cyclobacteriaceae bacterium]|nr:CHAT domain-containing protein [Cyclobacteriaceae bacterium]
MRSPSPLLQFILFLLLIPQFAVSQSDTLVYHQLFLKGETALAERKLDDARNFYLLSLKQAKLTIHQIKSRRKIASAYYLMNQLDSAEIAIAPNLNLKTEGINASEAMELSETYFRIVRALAIKKADYKKARYAIEKAIELLSSKNVSIKKYASYYIDLGITYWNDGDYDNAEAYYHKSLSLLTEAGPSFGEKDKVRAYISLGLVYWSKRHLMKAADHYQIALRIMERDPSNYAKDLSITYNNLGNLLSESKQYDSAVHYFTRAISNLEEVKKTPFFNLVEGFRAQFLNNLGITLVHLQKHDEAERTYLQSLQILKTYSDKNLLAKVHLNLGTCYQKKQEWQKSISNLQHGLNLKKEIYGAMHAEVSKAYNLFGELHIAKREFRLASLYFDSAIRYNPKVIVDGVSVYSSLEEIWYSISGGVECIQQQNLLTKSEAKLESLFLTAKSQLVYTFLHSQDELLMEDIQMLFNRFFTAYYTLYEKGKGKKHLQRLWEIAEYKKGLKINSQLNQLVALHQLIPKPLAELERSLRDSLSQLVNLKMMDKATNQTDSSLLLLRNQYDNLVQKFESEYPSYFALRYALPETDLDKLLKSIQHSDVIINYFETPEKLYSIVVHKDSTYAQAHHGEINKRISEMNQALFTNQPELLKSNAALLQQLILPTFKTAGIRHLIILPDGNMWSVQFTLLPGYLPNSLLGQELNITYQYTATNNQPTRRANSNNGKVLAFSASSLESNETQYYTTFRNINDEIPGASQEVQQIASVRDGDYFFGAGATETVFKLNAPEYQILHLATHGDLNLKEPNYSNLIFSKNDTINDGLLHAYEIYSLHLNAELAVLSACNSGNGQIRNGDGIISLGRAFAFAGVNSLLLSKWEVSDATAPLIMKYFYEGLEEGLTKSEALRLAKLKFLKNDADNITSSPYYWDSFYILGSDEPIAKKLSTTSIILITLGCLAFVTGVYWVFNRRKK